MIALSGPAADCEQLGDGLLAQPVNSISSLAMVAAGVLLIVSARRSESQDPAHYLGSLLLLAGIGSAAFHGFPGPTTTWVHDASLIGLLLAAAVFELGRRTNSEWKGSWWWISFPIAAVAAALWPEVTSTVAVVLATSATGLAAAPSQWTWGDSEADSSDDRGRALVIPCAVLAFGFGVYLVSRTDGPLCEPASLFQGHSIWHVSIAIGVALYARTLRSGSYSGVT